MNKALAYMVRRTPEGLYCVAWQSEKTLNWVPCAWYRDINDAEDMCVMLARLEHVTPYNLGGYEMKVLPPRTKTE